MWFNSLEFGAFLVLVFSGYWMLSSNRYKRGLDYLLKGYKKIKKISMLQKAM
jgi:hypothetical protein